MIAVITGDIINSSDKEPKVWLKVLKQVLGKYGETPKDWVIYRGDSFQLSINPEDALVVAIQIKSGIKQIEDLDVRLGIGLGEIDFESSKITESNGSAFVRSGESFEDLKKHLDFMMYKQDIIDYSFDHTVELEFPALYNQSGES